MVKEEYREAAEHVIDEYEWSALRHTDDESDPMKDYEWSLLNYNDEDTGVDDYDHGTIRHFQD